MINDLILLICLGLALIAFLYRSRFFYKDLIFCIKMAFIEFSRAWKMKTRIRKMLDKFDSVPF